MNENAWKKVRWIAGSIIFLSFISMFVFGQNYNGYGKGNPVHLDIFFLVVGVLVALSCIVLVVSYVKELTGNKVTPVTILIAVVLAGLIYGVITYF